MKKKLLNSLFFFSFLIFSAQISYAQYCVPVYDNGCTSDDDINSFSLTGQGASTISDLNTACGPGNGYEDRTAVIPAVDLMQGGTYAGTVTTDYFGSEFYRIWIDFNNDFVFDASEDVSGGNVGPFGNSSPSSFNLNIPLGVATGQHRMRVRLAYNVNALIDPCSLYSFGETHDYLANILAAPPCAGTPSITSVNPAGPISSCAGATQTLSVTLPIASGYTFQWQQSTNGGTTWNNVGTNSTTYTFTVTGNSLYRIYVVCNASASADTSANVTVNAAPPVYAAIPYFQDFENWTNYCDNSDIPDGASTNWTNNPATGDNSWRREDEGFTANWSATWGAYFPSSYSNVHSARFPTAASVQGVPGNLDLYLDCSQQNGNKQLYFYMINDGQFSFGDNLNILLSTNGGTSFTQLASFDTSTAWSKKSLPIVSNSAQTIVRFQAINNNFDFTDIGIDSVYIAPPCTGTVAAGSISPGGPVAGCPGSSYTLGTLGTTLAGNITYQWQQSVNNGVTWTDISGANSVPFVSPALYDTIMYRMYVICNSSSSSDTTAPVTINISSPVYASVPYVQDFENWISYCAVSDIPSGTANNWTNNPSTGDNSWRRDDEGFTANWSGTWGAYTPVSYSGSHSARFPTAASLVGIPGNLDLFLNCSQQTGGKQLYFYMINDGQFFQGDSLNIFLSTNGGASFTQIGGFDSATNWTRKSLPIVSNSPQTVVRFQAINVNFDFTDIGIDSVFIAPPCVGTVDAGTITPAGPVTGCTGTSYNLGTTGTTLAGNITYQWQESVNNGANWTNVAGANSISFTTPALYDTVWYRLYIICNGSGSSDTTAPLVLNIASPVYATLPYVQGFENWVSYCNVLDVPSYNWLNTPSTTDLSWRRDDQGASANWNAPVSGGYLPASYEANHSARFHTWNANWGSTGDLDLFVDLSPAGNKELQFHHINPSGSDALDIYLSEDGGQTFNLLQSFFNASAWTQNIVPLTSTAPNAIIRFRATSDFSDDMGLDNVMILLPCAGSPVAGEVDSLNPCSGAPFTLTTIGGTVAAGMSYQWEESPDGINWTASLNGNNAFLMSSITAATWYRLIVTCNNSGISDTSAPRLINLGSFYLCYCQSTAVLTDEADIGNFKVQKYPSGQVLLNNGTASPLTGNPAATEMYTNFTTLPAIELYQDSTYRFSVTQINSDVFQSCNIGIYLDIDGDGTFNPVTERIFLQTTPPNTVTDLFQIPGNAHVGLTGLRVVMIQGGMPIPCGQYTWGETEDYLVYINYPPCNNAPNAGTAMISDTLLCPGFPFMLVDSTHDKLNGGLSWIWQSSTDNINWTDIAGSINHDTLTQISGNVLTYYRLKNTCMNSGMETFSNVVNLPINPPYLCYCPSFANGGSADLSDVGAFSIGLYVTNSGGGHLNNPKAIRGYTGYPYPALLFADSTYDMGVYHIIRNATQQDAKVTLFIDFNNNFIYDVPAERVFTGFINSAPYWVNGSVTIPANAVKNVYTGMRLIINNDIGPNIPSDEACGVYTSGETEDYALMIKDKSALGIGSVSRGPEFMVYPNPATDKVSIKILKAAPGMVKIKVTNITGQTLFTEQYQHSGSEFLRTIDLQGLSKGVYFVEVATNSGKSSRKLVVR